MSQTSMSCTAEFVRNATLRAEELNLSLSAYLRKCVDWEQRERFLKPGPKRRMNQKGAR
jgi:hypothetical protein